VNLQGIETITQPADFVELALASLLPLRDVMIGHTRMVKKLIFASEEEEFTRPETHAAPRS
jgi:hypothetical protein